MHGVLLRKIRFSDTSLIITWFTDARGKIKTIAKGALRPKSPFVGRLDLFFNCDLLLSLARKSEIHTLREVSVLQPFDGIRRNYVNTAVASYFVELIEEVTELDHPVTEIYNLLLRAFGYLDASAPNAKTITFFESELCKCMGLQGNGSRVPAAERIVEAFGRLPRSRGEVMGMLQPR
jgi:DNA repair protein RecO (recombination protein O)